MLEQEGEALRDAVVTQQPLLRRERALGVGEVLRVAGLVEERAVVLLAALREAGLPL